jgi:Trk K+ transport system NAD-binding subunit
LGDRLELGRDFRREQRLRPARPGQHLLTLRNVHFLESNLRPGSPALGKPLRDLNIPADSILALVIRDVRQAVVPHGKTVLQAGDQVIAVTTEASEPALRRIMTG